MTARTVQNIFDEERENDEGITDLQDEIEYAREELAKCLAKQAALEAEREDLEIDLVKQNKMIFVECDMNKWREYVETYTRESHTYYIYYYDGSIASQGYFRIITGFTPDDDKHFLKYMNDYFYYGYPNYQDVNHHLSQESECQMAFGSGTASLKCIEF